MKNSHKSQSDIDVSILITTYNVERLMKDGRFVVYDMLESIVQNKHDDLKLEVLFSDNASTDGTTKILETWIAQNPVFECKILKKEINSGTPWDGLRDMIGLCQGKYFFQVDPDDKIGSEDVLWAMFQYAEEHDSDIVIGDASYERKRTGQPLKTFTPKENQPRLDFFKRNHFASFALWSKLWKTSFIRDINANHIFNSNLFLSMDGMFNAFVLSKTDKISYLGDRICYHYIKTDDGTNMVNSQFMTDNRLLEAKNFIEALLNFKKQETDFMIIRAAGWLERTLPVIVDILYTKTHSREEYLRKRNLHSKFQGVLYRVYSPLVESATITPNARYIEIIRKNNFDDANEKINAIKFISEFSGYINPKHCPFVDSIEKSLYLKQIFDQYNNDALDAKLTVPKTEEFLLTIKGKDNYNKISLVIMNRARTKRGSVYLKTGGNTIHVTKLLRDFNLTKADTYDFYFEVDYELVSIGKRIMFEYPKTAKFIDTKSEIRAEFYKNWKGGLSCVIK